MPKLSIVVPTRERADTLSSTLRTIVSQAYEDCEIIVSDNDSRDDTREVVASLGDSRIRYINTGRRVSMAENWEWAFRHARGDFLTYIGDDDGFVPGAIGKAMELLESSGKEALVWDKIEYHWPDNTDQFRKNWFSMRIDNDHVTIVEARKVLSKVLAFDEGYTRLPCLYNGIIRKRWLDDLAGRSSNERFFNAISPDVFCSIALAHVMDCYLYSTYPFSVNGASRHSNGTSFSWDQTDDPNSPAGRFKAENSVQYDSRLKLAPTTQVCVMGEYLLVRGHLPHLRLPEPDWRHYVRMLVRNAQGARFPEAILRSATHTAAALNMPLRSPQKVRRYQEPATHVGLAGNVLSFTAPPEMVKNIDDACRLVGGMLPTVLEIASKESTVWRVLKKIKRRIRALAA